MTTFVGIIVLAFVAIAKVLFIRRYASEFPGKDENVIAKIRAFVKNHPRAGKILVGFIVIEFTIALFLMITITWNIFVRF